MDYDTLELLAGGALALFPVVVLLIAGLLCLRNARVRMPWYLIAGLVGSLAYGWFAPQLALWIFPPPDNPDVLGANDLDLRGLILAFGVMVGCAAGLVTTTVFFIVYFVRQLWHKRAGNRGAGAARVLPERPARAPRSAA